MPTTANTKSAGQCVRGAAQTRANNTAVRCESLIAQALQQIAYPISITERQPGEHVLGSAVTMALRGVYALKANVGSLYAGSPPMAWTEMRVHQRRRECDAIWLHLSESLSSSRITTRSSILGDFVEEQTRTEREREQTDERERRERGAWWIRARKTEQRHRILRIKLRLQRRAKPARACNCLPRLRPRPLNQTRARQDQRDLARRAARLVLKQQMTLLSGMRQALLPLGLPLLSDST